MTNPPALSEDDKRSFPNLTELQERFVHEYVANGGNASAAAKQAGYAEVSAHVTASRMLKNDAIIQAVTMATMRRLGTALPGALAKVMKLSSSAKSERIQLEASADLLDRAGLVAPKQVRVGGSLSVTFDLG
jgi:phage terminase small subunit